MKGFLILFLVIILALPFITSVEIIADENFDSGETLLAIISGNFIDQITEGDIAFFKDHIRVPVDFEVQRIREDFYLWASLSGKTKGNYSFIIDNVRFMKGVNIVKEKIVKNFTVSDNTTDFSISPGFSVDKKVFDVVIQNLQEVEITIEITPSDLIFSEFSAITLKSGEEKKLSFEIINENFFKENVIFSTANQNYTFPVFIENASVIKGDKISLIFFQKELNIFLNFKSSKIEEIILINNGETEQNNIFVTPSANLIEFVNFTDDSDRIVSLKPGESVKIPANFFSSNVSVNLTGFIMAKSLSATSTLAVNLEINETFNKKPSVFQNCPDLGGLICDIDSQECSGETIDARDGVCCLGQCTDIKKSSTGKIIGWILVALVIIYILWFFLSKFRKPKNKVSLLDFLKKRKE